METLKKIVSNQYFPAAAVLTAVVLFWAVGLLGGLSLLHNNQPPLATLTWMLFVYGAAVLTPIAGLLAAADLVRRWQRNRAADAGAGAAPAVEAAAELQYQRQPVPDLPAQQQPEQPAQQPAQQMTAPTKPVQQKPAQQKPVQQKPVQKKAAQKKPVQKKQGPKKAA